MLMVAVVMYKSTGDDLVNTLTNLNVDFRHLKPNVINAWFDTDCKDTKDLLNWLCISLSDVNYVDPLERAEFDNFEEQLESDKCAEELAKLNPHYLSMLDDSQNLEEIWLTEDFIDLLEEEHKDLDNLIKVYENIDNNISSDLTHKTQKEIQSKLEAKLLQEICENLSRNLDELNKILQKMLVKYDPDSNIVNFVNVKEYHENMENLSSFLIPLMEIDKTFLEKSDEYFSDELETCRKRILHSHQIFLANKVETEKLLEILEFLEKTNLNDNMLSWNTLSSNESLEAKELYKKRMCDVLDSIASKLADHYLKQTRIHYVQKELDEFQQRSQNVSKLLENVTESLCYYVLTNCLQFEEKKDVECIHNFYQKMVEYVNEDLHRCSARTEKMKMIIEEYNAYLAKPACERSKLISSIAKCLSSDGCTLKSAAEAIGKFKAELNLLESQVFTIDFKSGREKTQQINENINILRSFLISGPTNRVVLISPDLQKVWLEIDEHLKKQSASVGETVRVPQKTMKAMTKAQNYTRQLLLAFFATPEKLDSILKQAEDDFKKKTQQYF